LTALLATVVNARRLRALFATSPAAIVQIEHATSTLPCGFENSHSRPTKAVESVDNGPSPDFVIHVQSVNLKLQAHIVPKAQ
jgi:hypothetical protein